MQDWGAVERVRAVVAEPSAHPDRLLGAIAMLSAARQCLKDAETDLVARARAEGLTWREIAAAMSLGSPQAAAQRAHRRPPRKGVVREQSSTWHHDGTTATGVGPRGGVRPVDEIPETDVHRPTPRPRPTNGGAR